MSAWPVSVEAAVCEMRLMSARLAAIADATEFAAIGAAQIPADQSGASHDPSDLPSGSTCFAATEERRASMGRVADAHCTCGFHAMYQMRPRFASQNSCFSPVVAGSEAATSDAPAMTVQEGTGIQSPGVGVVGCRCAAAPADSSHESKKPGAGTPGRDKNLGGSEIV